MDDPTANQALKRFKFLDETDAETLEITCNKNFESISDTELDSNGDYFEGSQIFPEFDIYPEFETASNETLDKEAQLQQDIIDACEVVGGEATLANVMENSASSGLALNFLASLFLAADGKLQFDPKPKQDEVLKPEDLGLKLNAQP